MEIRIRGGDPRNRGLHTLRQGAPSILSRSFRLRTLYNGVIYVIYTLITYLPTSIETNFYKYRKRLFDYRERRPR